MKFRKKVTPNRVIFFLINCAHKKCLVEGELDEASTFHYSFPPLVISLKTDFINGIGKDKGVDCQRTWTLDKAKEATWNFWKTTGPDSSWGTNTSSML